MGESDGLGNGSNVFRSNLVIFMCGSKQAVQGRSDLSFFNVVNSKWIKYDYGNHNTKRIN